MPTQSRLPHLVRGTTAAMIATFASLFSHVLAGGEVPAFLGIVTPLVLSLMVCILLAGRRLSLLRLSISVIASQTLFHTLFVLGTPLPGGTVDAAMPAGHSHGATPFVLPASLDSTATLVHGDTTMWISHVLGAVVTILFLYRGEEAILKVREVAESFVIWVGCATYAPLRLTALPAPQRPQTGEPAGWTVLNQLHSSSLRRRGPPARLHLAR